MNAAPWTIITNDAVESDLRALDESRRKEVLRALKKVSRNPLPASIGKAGKILFVVFVEKEYGNVIRLISARKATAEERREYYGNGNG